MKDRVKAKRIARYYDQCRLPMWANVLGIVLLVFGLVAAGITAIFHDKYSSIFGAWESALTNVWFIAFIALVGVGALISLGYPLLTLIGAWIWTLFAKQEPEVAEEHLVPDTTEVKKEAPVGEEKAFYDILKAVRDKYEFPYEEERLIDLAKQIKLIIDDKSRYVDWATRTDRKAELKMDIVITLAKNKYPPFTKDEVFKEILEQAENFKKNRLIDGYQIREPEYHMVAEPEGPKYGTRLNINDE